jgi:Family of unknown function (DUF7009)
MKLRIRGDSLRMRVTPSEMSRLLQSGRIEETIHFGLESDAKLTYAVMIVPAQNGGVALRYLPHEIAVVIPAVLAHAWASGEQVGVYGAVNTGAGQLEIAVEKDFACLDKSDAENEDTYPNPNEGVVC